MNRTMAAVEFCAALACTLLLWAVGALLLLADNVLREEPTATRCD
jgi:hypothetical protein